ncbi:type II toxin-antitoxin system RelE/ParE family toxin [Haematobacter missouriensis]|nr:type II toxin-antitoxin system RelE/ParE family toxin [Haematobacter missouriensis]
MMTEHQMHCVIETHNFADAAKEVGLDEEDRRRITLYLSANPTAGDLIKETGGARKLRFPFRGRGKSGGVRVITYYAADDVPVFLLDVYDKTVKINLSKAERNALRVELAKMADTYRANNQEKIRALKRMES